jgi:hypothetical protein
MAFFREVGGLTSETERMGGILEIARSAGWWWPFQNAVILTERPTELHMRDGRLHNDEGSAILYPDGTGVWALNGLRVDRRLVEQPETLTFSEVRDERNTEIRRHMMDRFGGLRGSAAAGAWLSAGGLHPISQTDITDKMQPSGLSIWRLSHKDEPVLCRLYRAEMPEDEPLVLLTVVCTSTAKEVFLRVPPTMKDAAAARDWTFGVSLSEAIET